MTIATRCPKCKSLNLTFTERLIQTGTYSQDRYGDISDGEFESKAHPQWPLLVTCDECKHAWNLPLHYITELPNPPECRLHFPTVGG